MGPCDIDGLAGVVFSGLSSLVIEDVTDQDGVIVVRARTAGGPVPCPQCGGPAGQVHGYYGRTVADVVGAENLRTSRRTSQPQQNTLS